MKKTVKSLWLSAISMLLCIAMLSGATFAWFTDSASSGRNVISAGNLDIGMYWTKDLTSGEWIDAEDTTAEPVFNYDNWEPGYTEVRYVKIVNNGTLSFKYALSIIAEGEIGPLADVIDVYFVESPTENVPNRGALADMASVGTLRQAIIGSIPANGVLLAENQTKAGFYSGEIIVAIALKMREEAGNEYQGLSVGDGFYLRLDATQYNFENDSLGDDYDANVQLPGPIVDSEGTVAVTPVNGLVPAGGVAIDAGNGITANVPEGVKMKSGANALTLSVANMSETNANLFMGASEKQTSLNVHIEGVATDNTVPMEITVERAAAKGLNSTSLKLYHVENGATVQMTLIGLNDAFTAHNQFKYDPATGNITLYMATFSEIAMTTNTNNKWEGGFDYSWYDPNATELYIANAEQFAAFGAIVGGMKKVTGRVDKKYTYSDEIIQDSFAGKTVYMVCDIYIGDITDEDERNIVLYPVGYYNTDETYERTDHAVSSGFRNFEGTFDGQGHTISDIYQNTWEMKGDHNWYDATLQYYRDGMGLFGKVYGGTIKNLVVDNFQSDGEIATTGVIAAYADCGAKFENITIFNCNPRVYNIGNGGIVGCVGWYAHEVTEKVLFKNITVDNSNKISALWGSYDVPCGGIVGQYYPTSGQSEGVKNAGIHFENCHVGAQIDVFNDVCANYQYYAYRYAGILMGSVRENVTENGHEVPDMETISAEGCTVHFGDWNDYYYCELVANSLASYTHDHQMSRLVQVQSVDVVNKTVTDLNGVTTAIPTSGRQNYVVVNKNDDGTWNHGDGAEHATCYHFVNGVQHFHDKADSDNPNVYETVDNKEVLKEDKQCIYREFNNLVTGYGWGVTSKGIGQMDGVTLLDNTKNSPDSVEKFTVNNKVTTDKKSEFAIKLKELFNGEEGLRYAIKPESIQVTVTNVTDSTGNTYDPNGKVTYKLERNINNWEESTITFSGEGWVKVTIQDYYYCKPTSIVINVTEATMNLLITGDKLYEAVTTTGKDGNVKLSSNVDTAKTKRTDDGYVRVVAANSNGSAASYNAETYFYLLTGNTGASKIETGKYFVMKYRIPEKADPYINFTSLQIYTDSGSYSHALAENEFNYNVIDTDGEWHILVIDLSKNNTATEHYVADEYGRYYANFVRVDIFANVPAGQAMDIEFIGMASDMADIKNTVNKIQNDENYNSKNKVAHFDFVEENVGKYNIVAMADNSNYIDSSSFVNNANQIAQKIPYFVHIDFAHIIASTSAEHETVSGNNSSYFDSIQILDYNNRCANTLYVNGWAVVEGGIHEYVWSVDGGETWITFDNNLQNNTFADSDNEKIQIATNDLNGKHIFSNNSGKNGKFQGNSILRVNFDNKGYTGVKDIIVAAVPTQEQTKKIILAVIKNVEISSEKNVDYCDIDGFIDNSLFAQYKGNYSMTLDITNGASDDIAILNKTTINYPENYHLKRIIYGSNFGDVVYQGTDKSISSVKLNVTKFKIADNETEVVKKYVWSYDGTVWYDVEDGMIDFAKLIADKPWLNNRKVDITIAAIPKTDTVSDDGKIELCVMMRLLDFRIGLKDDKKCVGENHVMIATPKYAIDENGYLKLMKYCVCGKTHEVVGSIDAPNYVINFDYLGNNNTSNGTRFSNVHSKTYTQITEYDVSGVYTTAASKVDDIKTNNFTAKSDGSFNAYGWIGVSGGFTAIKYRVINTNNSEILQNWTTIDLKNEASGSATDIMNNYNFDATGVRFGGTDAINLSNFLKNADDRVTIEFAFTYTYTDPEIVQTFGKTEVLVFAGRFTNVRPFVKATPDTAQ